MILAVDLDGTIHDDKHPVPGRKMGAPLPGAKENLIRFKQRGDTIIIFSVWGNKPKVISDWLNYYEIPFSEITNIKPDADVFIDNRALRFLSWKQVEKDLKQYV